MQRMDKARPAAAPRQSKPLGRVLGIWGTGRIQLQAFFSRLRNRWFPLSPLVYALLNFMTARVVEQLIRQPSQEKRGRSRHRTGPGKNPDLWR